MTPPGAIKFRIKNISHRPARTRNSRTMRRRSWQRRYETEWAALASILRPITRSTTARTFVGFFIRRCCNLMGILWDSQRAWAVLIKAPRCSPHVEHPALCARHPRSTGLINYNGSGDSNALFFVGANGFFRKRPGGPKLNF